VASCRAAFSIASAVAAAALTTCSQLSMIINARLSPSQATRLLSGSPTPGGLPRIALTALGTSAGKPSTVGIGAAQRLGGRSRDGCFSYTIRADDRKEASLS
jgi:hypothetical protein